jgi:hypothetical protein
MAGAKHPLENPFIIRALAIDGGSLSDAALAEILEGLAVQKACRRITCRGNELGPKAAEQLIAICDQKGDSSILDLTLSNIKVLRNPLSDTDSEELSFLA